MTATSPRGTKGAGNPKKYRFVAAIKDAGGGGAFIEFPHDVRKEFGTGGRVPVKVTFDGEPYRGSLMPMGGPRHIVGILKAIRMKLGKGMGDAVAVVLERDDEERTVEVPPELRAALKGHTSAARRFETMSYTHRKEWARFVGEAKNPETRRRRAEKAVKEILAMPDRSSQNKDGRKGVTPQRKQSI